MTAVVEAAPLVVARQRKPAEPPAHKSGEHADDRIAPDAGRLAPSEPAGPSTADPGGPPATPDRAGRTRTWLRRRALMLLIVFLPPTLLSLYYALSAQERFVSASTVTVRRAAVEAPSGSGLAMLVAGVGGLANEDVRYLREYLHSMGLMKALDQQLDLRNHYGSAWRDPFFRLWPQASQEWMLDYWRARVELTLDESSGLLTLKVQAFDPETARRINATLLAHGDRFVNQISQKIAGEQVAFAQAELDRAAERLRQTRSAVVAFQAANRVLDPVGEAKAAGALSAELRAQLARVEAELTAKRGYLNEDAPDVAALVGQVNALRAQVERETASATRGDGKRSLGQLAVRFEDLKTQAGFAEQAYRTALAMVETTRVENARRAKSMVIIEPPTTPEMAEYPRRLYNLAAVLVASVLAYAIAGMAMATVREHRD